MDENTQFRQAVDLVVAKALLERDIKQKAHKRKNIIYNILAFIIFVFAIPYFSDDLFFYANYMIESSIRHLQLLDKALKGVRFLFSDIEKYIPKL